MVCRTSVCKLEEMLKNQYDYELNERATEEKGLVAVMGEIQATFHRVKVAKEDRDFLRFLWWPDGDLAKDVAEFRLFISLVLYPLHDVPALH